MTGYYLFFLLYVLFGALACAFVFYKAVVTGQFNDQERARYLPLFDRSPAGEVPVQGRWPKSMLFTILVIVAALILQILAVLVMVLA